MILPFAHRHAGKPALRDFVPIRRLAPGTRFRFRSPAWAGGPQPVHGPVGVVVGPGNAGGVLVAGALVDWNAPEGFAAQYGKRLGVDVAKIVDAADPEGARAAADKKAGIKELARFKGAKKKGKKK